MRSPGTRGDSPWSKLNAPLFAGLLATAVSLVLFVAHTWGWVVIPGLAGLERLSVDARFRLRGLRAPRGDEIVIVGLDDKTREQAVELFQTRRGLAALFDALNDYHPKVVGLDMLFGYPESPLRSTIVAEVRAAREALGRESALSPAAQKARSALEAVLEETRSDEILAHAVARSQRMVLGLMFYFPDAGQMPASDIEEPLGLSEARYTEYVATDGARSRRPPAAFAVTRSLPVIARAGAGAGALNVSPDDDGSVRSLFAVVAYGGRYYMPLGLAVVVRALDVDISYVAGATSIQMGDRRLPVSMRGEALLDHLGPSKTFPHVSAVDVLHKRVPREVLQGKIVFVGHTDAARDKVITPFDPQLDGVEIHATLAHNALHGELLRRSQPLTTLLTIALLGGILTLLQLRRIRRRRAWIVAAVAPVIIAGYLIVAHVVFSDGGLLLDIAAPTLACAFLTVTSLGAALATEGREKTQLRRAFSQYVSEVVVERIIADPAGACLGGVRRDLTVLFSDIRGFSSFAEALEPEILSEYLNEYLTPMTELVLDSGGMLDKYIGDAIMAVYGAPIETRDHARAACKTALAMIDALEPLNRHWREHGLPDIAIGIGINSGPMAVGNMGSQARFSYTVIGDTVNLGARLESLTREYRVDVLAGEETYEAARTHYGFREVDWVRVKGRAGATRIYELLGPKSDHWLSDEAARIYDEGLAAYRERDWDVAERRFDEFLALHPEDGPTAVMRERVQMLRAHPPGAEWDGVFEQLSK